MAPLAKYSPEEFTIKSNAPGQRNGRIAACIGGELAADLPLLRLRDPDCLTIHYKPGNTLALRTCHPRILSIEQDLTK